MQNSGSTSENQARRRKYGENPAMQRKNKKIKIIMNNKEEAKGKNNEDR